MNIFYKVLLFLNVEVLEYLVTLFSLILEFYFPNDQEMSEESFESTDQVKFLDFRIKQRDANEVMCLCVN